MEDKIINCSIEVSFPSINHLYQLLTIYMLLLSILHFITYHNVFICVNIQKTCAKIIIDAKIILMWGKELKGFHEDIYQKYISSV